MEFDLSNQYLPWFVCNINILYIKTLVYAAKTQKHSDSAVRIYLIKASLKEKLKHLANALTDVCDAETCGDLIFIVKQITQGCEVVQGCQFQTVFIINHLFPYTCKSSILD